MVYQIKITKLRNKHGWTKTQLAEKSGVSQTYISELEAGKKNATVAILTKIARAFEIPVAELLRDDLTPTGTEGEIKGS